MPLTVLMNAGPWVSVPPRGYGGIEAVVATLVPELRRRGVRVVLATVGGSTLEAERHVARFADGQFAHIAEPYNRSMGIAHAHMQAVVGELRRARDIDLVHDHLEVVGPSVLATLGEAGPPALQTLHWDLAKHPDFYGHFDGGGRVYFAGVSAPQLERAPAALRRQALGAVPLGVPVDVYRPAPKARHLLVLARITPDKGQEVAARACRARGLPLTIAGPVAGVPTPGELDAALADPASPLHEDRDVGFYLRRVRPLEDGDGVRWIGAVAGAQKRRLIGEARALLCPISWEEPGGTAVVEALASGTPVVGMRRGCLPLLVDHGVTGFLADDEDEFGDYLGRIDELDPAACRRAAEQRFSAEVMAERYIELYREVLRRALPS